MIEAVRHTLLTASKTRLHRMLLFTHVIPILSLEDLVGEQLYRLLISGRLRAYRLVGWLGYESLEYPYERLG